MTGLNAQQIETGTGDITVGGRLQLQYATTSVDSAVSDIFVRRARIKLDVDVGDLVQGRLQPDVAGGKVALQDAFVKLAIDPAFEFSMGQLKRAFSVFELVSSADLPIVERDGRVPGVDECSGVGGVCTFSRLTEVLQFDGRDVGIRAEGELGAGLSYLATLTNGEGINTADINDAKSLSGRVEYTRGPVVVGGFVGSHDYQDGDEETKRATALGADLAVGSWRSGFHLLSSAVFGDNWEVGPDARFGTLQVLASVYLPLSAERIDGVEPLLRVSWADPDRDLPDDGALHVTPGVMLYLAGKSGISFNLDLYSPQGDSDSETSFKVMTYLYF